MVTRPEIERLIHQVARRHDGRLARNLVFRVLGIAAAVSSLASLAWVARGHAVPAAVPLGLLAVAVVAGVIWWTMKRMRPAAAVREADRFFDLKDAIASARHLAATRPEDPATELQWEWLKPRLSTCDARAMVSPFPRRAAVIATCLLAAAVWLGVLPPSPAVRAAEQAARETRERVAESKQEIEKLIEELEKDITAPEEKEALKMDEYRKMVEAISETGDKAEAARQFARIEQKIRDASRALDQRRDEETLHLAAKELAKAEETQARQLGKKLEDKELKEAAEMLEKLAGKKLDPKDLKNPEEKKKKLDEAKQELAKMRAISKRLAAAGKQRQGARQAQGQQNAQNAQGQGADGGDQGQNSEAGGQQAEPLEDLMAEIDDAAAEAEKELQELELDPDAEKGDGEAMEKANGALGKMGKHMKGMHGKRLAKGKLDQLRDGLAQAGAMQGQSQMLGLAQGQGGRKAGEGTDQTRRNEKDDSQKNGQLAELKGQHGEGPSLSAVEEADSGTGVSGRRGEAKQREFARQTESFVQRDDVPESLKLGVRNYFENLQSAQPAAKEDK